MKNTLLHSMTLTVKAQTVKALATKTLNSKTASAALLALLWSATSPITYAAPLTLDTQALLENTEARAYKAYYLAFLWPEKMSSEYIKYEDVLNLKQIPREIPQKQAPEFEFDNASGADIAAFNSPFDDYQAKLDARVTILANESWTLIFEGQGSEVAQTFYSDTLWDGYPELTGTIKIKLGRYLESNITLTHYLFDSFTSPIDNEEPIENTLGNTAENPLEHTANKTIENMAGYTSQQQAIKLYEPGLMLSLQQTNKTASQKLNYLDHPIIGSLLYFEPMEMEDAIQQLSLEALLPEPAPENLPLSNSAL